MTRARREIRLACLVLAAVSIVAASTALALFARVDRSPDTTRLEPRAARSHETTIVGSIWALDVPGMTINDAHNHFVNVLTDAHTIVSRSQPARSTDIAAGEYIVAVGTLAGPDFAARWLIDEGHTADPPLSTTRLRPTSGYSDCRITAGTVRSTASAITIVTGSGTRVSVKVSRATETTRESTQHIADLVRGAAVEISGVPDPNYGDVTLATLIRIGQPKAYPSCRKE